MTNKFSFFEIVKVETSDPEYSEVNGCEGVIFGRAEQEEGEFSYSVHFGCGGGWSIEEKYLVATGKRSKREYFYKGESVKLVVDEYGHSDLTDEQ